MAETQAPHERARALDELRRYWNTDSSTYDAWPEHGAWTPGERAAWASTLTRLLPPAPARILDVGAGTGFLALAAARLGHDVTAVDISDGMLGRLRASAAREGLAVKTACVPADEPPEGPFDVVTERLALWTLPDPETALAAWRRATPGGRLLAFEAVSVRDYAEGARRRARTLLARLRRTPPEHHGSYGEGLRAALPLSGGASHDALIGRVEAAGWQRVQMSRLRDVQWARELALSPLERLLGATPEYVLRAD